MIAPNHMVFRRKGCADGCTESTENWLCLVCGETRCSRYVKKHGLKHYETTGHTPALSTSDLSTWCYKCNAYVKHPRLHELVTRASSLKFGEGSGGAVRAAVGVPVQALGAASPATALAAAVVVAVVAAAAAAAAVVLTCSRKVLGSGSNGGHRWIASTRRSQPLLRQMQRQMQHQMPSQAVWNPMRNQWGGSRPMPPNVAHCSPSPSPPQMAVYASPSHLVLRRARRCQRCRM